MTRSESSSRSVAGAVLAGGMSRRMGRDKSLLRLAGRTLTALAADKLLQAGYAPVFVVGPVKAYGLPPGVKILSESFAGQGPLSGLEAVLSHAKGPSLILPCDMPDISVYLLQKLRSRHLSGFHLTAFQGMPMPAIYSERLLPRIRSNLKKQRNALYPILGWQKAQLLPVTKLKSFQNLNDPQAWKRFLKVAHSGL